MTMLAVILGAPLLPPRPFYSEFYDSNYKYSLDLPSYQAKPLSLSLRILQPFVGLPASTFAPTILPRQAEDFFF